ncbi:MAG: hypothetical protein COB04_13645 [Gammaproteobacteria bacterium]|nr:MAG: hypothetical protein COB04_13645 [Gammaproteobacteria bacterium]
MNTEVQRFTPASVDIHARKITFASAVDKERYWMAGSKLFTTGFNFASMLFPEGETFFIKSVQNFQSQIVDPKLRDDINGFIAQEITHAQEHEKYNEDAYDNGFYKLRGMEKILRSILVGSHRWVPKKFQLSFTVTAEHFTAIGANIGLQFPDLIMGAVDPKYREIWLWHAVEETEHKGVAFDVLKAVSGNYWLRIMPLAIILLLALVSSVIAAVILPPLALINKIRGKGIFSKPKGRPLPKSIKREIVLARNMFLKDLFSFFKPSFHPWDCDNSSFVEDWKSNYAATGKSALTQEA